MYIFQSGNFCPVISGLKICFWNLGFFYLWCHTFSNLLTFYHSFMCCCNIKTSNPPMFHDVIYERPSSPESVWNFLFLTDPEKLNNCCFSVDAPTKWRHVKGLNKNLSRGEERGEKSKDVQEVKIYRHFLADMRKRAACMTSQFIWIWGSFINNVTVLRGSRYYSTKALVIKSLIRACQKITKFYLYVFTTHMKE